MRPSEKLINELCLTEGFEKHAYPDPGSADGTPWTIGYGTTEYPDGRSVREGDVCDQEQAREWLLFHVEKKCVKTIERYVLVQIGQNQFDALVSFIYNIGAGDQKKGTGFAGSTMLRKLNAGDYEGAAGEFKRWNKQNGSVMVGLTRRRLEEEMLFRRPDDY